MRSYLSICKITSTESSKETDDVANKPPTSICWPLKPNEMYLLAIEFLGNKTWSLIDWHSLGLIAAIMNFSLGLTAAVILGLIERHSLGLFRFTSSISAITFHLSCWRGETSLVYFAGLSKATTFREEQQQISYEFISYTQPNNKNCILILLQISYLIR